MSSESVERLSRKDTKMATLYPLSRSSTAFSAIVGSLANSDCWRSRRSSTIAGSSIPFSLARSMDWSHDLSSLSSAFCNCLISLIPFMSTSTDRYSILFSGKNVSSLSLSISVITPAVKSFCFRLPRSCRCIRAYVPRARTRAEGLESTWHTLRERSCQEGRRREWQRA